MATQELGMLLDAAIANEVAEEISLRHVTPV
jgi:hypothetical protein